MIYFCISLITEIIHIAILPITLYTLFQFLRNLKFRGEAFHVGWPEAFAQWYLEDVTIGNVIPLIFIKAILGFIIIGIVLALVLIGPYVVAVMLFTATNHLFVIARKNATYKFMYSVEEAFHKEHKKRMNGTEWWKSECDKNDQQNKARAKAKYENMKAEWEEYQKRKYSYYGSYNDYNDYRYESNGQQQQNSTYEPRRDEEFEAAKALFMIDDEMIQKNEVTSEELKRRRNGLVKSFHPDGSANAEADTKNTQKINNYYKLLKNRLNL